MFIFLSLTVSAVTYVKLGQQFVMFSPQLFRFFQRRANFHQVRLHLLDAYPYPFVTLHQSINQSINQSKVIYKKTADQEPGLDKLRKKKMELAWLQAEQK